MVIDLLWTSNNIKVDGHLHRNGGERQRKGSGGELLSIIEIVKRRMYTVVPSSVVRDARGEGGIQASVLNSCQV